MSDDQQFSSKRERQKARRAERLEKEAQQAKVASARQRGIYGLIALVVLGLVGALVFNQVRTRNEQAAEAEEVAARLDELGCTDDGDDEPGVRMPDLGGGHISGTPDALAAEAPGVIYTGTDEVPGQPPSSGRHIGQVVATGVYDVPIDPRLTTHNLEHGYVVAHYSPDADQATVDALTEWGQAQIDGDFPKVVVAPYFEPLPDGKQVSFTAWFQRQMCDEFDPAVANVFTRAHYDISGEGPEKGIPTHTIGAQGVLDPEGEPLFLPPLDAEFGTDSIFEEVEGAEPASPEVDPSPGDGSEPADAEPTDAATE